MYMPNIVHDVQVVLECRFKLTMVSAVQCISSFTHALYMLQAGSEDVLQLANQGAQQCQSMVQTFHGTNGIDNVNWLHAADTCSWWTLSGVQVTAAWPAAVAISGLLGW